MIKYSKKWFINNILNFLIALLFLYFIASVSFSYIESEKYVTAIFTAFIGLFSVLLGHYPINLFSIISFLKPTNILTALIYFIVCLVNSYGIYFISQLYNYSPSFDLVSFGLIILTSMLIVANITYLLKVIQDKKIRGLLNV
jgi:hypothetical protein